MFVGLQISNKCRTDITHQIMYVVALSFERCLYYLNVECTWWVSSKEHCRNGKKKKSFMMRTLTNVTSSWWPRLALTVISHLKQYDYDGTWSLWVLPRNEFPQCNLQKIILEGFPQSTWPVIIKIVSQQKQGKSEKLS